MQAQAETIVTLWSDMRAKAGTIVTLCSYMQAQPGTIVTLCSAMGAQDGTIVMLCNQMWTIEILYCGHVHLSDYNHPGEALSQEYTCGREMGRFTFQKYGMYCPWLNKVATNRTVRK